MPLNLGNANGDERASQMELITKMFLRMTNSSLAVSWSKQESYELAREHGRHTIISFAVYHEMVPMDENFIAGLLDRGLIMYYDEGRTRRQLPMEGAVRFRD